ncbi:MAG: CoA transferase [Candidatus Rokubacteria bacterium]|nr:CoA transferase [Candidatus Rokubacteria bacterium]
MPLSHLRVLDFTQVRAGPTCTKILADFGAEVIRIERPGEPDRAREAFDAVDLHRGKKSILLDLAKPAGLEVVHRLVPSTDVVVENFRPGVKHRLGIDYERLSSLNPRLIYASISGFGQSGPYADRPGYDQIVQGMSGLMSITGTETSGPLRIGIPIGDLLAGYFAAIGILVALAERERSGRGQWLDTSLLTALAGSLSFQAGKYLNTGEIPPPVGNHHPLTSPMGVYRARDGYLNLAVGSEVMWRRFCEAIGRPDLASDPRFATNQGRIDHRSALNGIIEDVFAGASTAEWVERLNAAGVAGGPIYDIGQVFGDPQVQQARLVEEVHHPLHGPVRVLGQPVFLHRTPAKVVAPSPLSGQHSREILRAAGYDAAAIERLLADGVAAESRLR